MQVISGERSSGKTTKLIRYAAEHGGYIVCHSQQEASRISRMARELNLNILYPITYDEAIHYPVEQRHSLYVDNIEFLLIHILKQLPKIITYTEEENVE